MNGYTTTWDRIAWDFICAKLTESKRRVGIYYGSIIMQSRGYGKTMTTRALYRALSTKFANECKIISVRWCEYFEIPNYRGRKNCIIYMAKVKRYILPKTCIRR